MFYPFICGGGSLHRQAESDTDELTSPRSTDSPPRKQRRSSLWRTKDSKNPYADRGLDKFSALLAELDDQRQKIYSEAGSEDISLVRFAYSNSNHIKPIVVRREKHNHTSEPPNQTEDVKRESENDEVRKESSEKMSFSWSFMAGMLRRPSWYLPAVVIMILLLLTFGRSFAILCTSIGWYLVPTIRGGSSSAKRPRRKKQHVKRAAGEGLSSPTSVIAGPMNDFSPPRRSHRKSW